MLVTRREFESQLAAVSARVVDPRAGLFGPDSVSWRVNREAVLLAGGGRAALLQLAHPAVSHAIEQHSPTRTDPQGRFVRTFTHVFAMLFGDLDSTLAAARRVHGTHARIGGRITEGGGESPAGARYAANDPEALLWVFATLVDTTLRVFDLMVRPLSREERAHYYDEAQRFAQLFGLSARWLPPDLDAFEQYMARTLDSDLLHVTAHARELAGFLLDSPSPLFVPVMRSYRTLTAGLLPERIRAAYGLPYGAGHARLYRLEIAGLRAALPALPRRLRYFPAYLDAERRLRGQGPDRLAHFVERMLLRNLPQAAR